MRRLTKPALVILALLFTPASYLTGQQATINTPVAPPADAKILVYRMEMTRNPPGAVVELTYQDASNNETKRLTFRVPVDPTNPGTELQDFASAIGSARASETGIATRRLNFRVLGYFVDAGRLPGVTLVP